MPNILREKEQLIFVKSETTYKTNPTIAGANAIGAHNINIKPVFEKIQSDDINGREGSQESFTVGEKVTVEFDFYLITGATAGTAPPCDPILLSSAMAKVIQSNTRVTYTPVSGSFGSMAVMWQINDYRHTVLGVRGEVTIDLSVGGFRKASFKGEGIYQDPIIASPLSNINQSGVKDPVAVRNETVSSCIFYGVQVQAKSVKFAPGSKFAHVSLVNHQEVEFTGREGSLDIEYRGTDADLRTAMSRAKNNTAGAFAISVGVADDKVICNMPNLSITDTPSLSFDNGVGYISLSTAIVPTAKNNDFSLVFE